MKSLFASLMLVSLIALPGTAFQSTLARPAGPLAQPANLVGRWRVKFALPGIGEKNLVFTARAEGAGSLLLLDAGPDGKSVTAPLPAAWAGTTNDRVSLSGEVELPIGTCCRDTGTLIFKGKFASSNSMSGKAIFITSTIDEENANGFRSLVGTFTAVLTPDN